MGFGLKRGGYQCVCKPGYYYPWWHDGPFLGIEIEQSTWAEYNYGFDCLAVQGCLLLSLHVAVLNCSLCTCTYEYVSALEMCNADSHFSWIVHLCIYDSSHR